MLLSTFSLLVALSATTVSAGKKHKQMQINYYSDKCKSYLTQIDVTWAKNLYDRNPNNCYNYQYGYAMNIAACDMNGASCFCNLWTDKNCQGGSYRIESNGGCMANIPNVKSFACYYQ